MNQKCWNYLVVRIDLPIEQQIVQASHAAYEAGVHFCTFNTSNSLVVCKVNSEYELLCEQERLCRHGIKFIVFREPDIGNQATAFCTEPIDDSRRKLFTKYKLWRLSHGSSSGAFVNSKVLQGETQS